MGRLFCPQLTLKFFMFNASANSQIVAQEFSLCMWIYIYIYIYLMNVFKAHCTKAMSVMLQLLDDIN
jgi:hypothetical protein